MYRPHLNHHRGPSRKRQGCSVGSTDSIPLDQHRLLSVNVALGGTKCMGKIE